MNEDELQALGQTAAYDQMSGSLTNTARAAGIYLRELKAGGLSDAQAMTLLRDWHAAWWQRVYFPPDGSGDA